jgi:hypothetical protein
MPKDLPVPSSPLVETALGVPLDSGYYWLSGFGSIQVPMIVYVHADDGDAGTVNVQLPSGQLVPATPDAFEGSKWAGPLQSPSFAP